MPPFRAPEAKVNVVSVYPPSASDPDLVAMPLAAEPTEPLKVQPRSLAVTCQAPDAFTVAFRACGPVLAALALPAAAVSGRARAADPSPAALMKSRRLIPVMRCSKSRCGTAQSALRR